MGKNKLVGSQTVISTRPVANGRCGKLVVCESLEDQTVDMSKNAANSMIKNIVFDFGQVLVHFDPSYMVGRYISEPNDAKLLEQVVFDRLYWDCLDAGTISDEKVIEACKQRLPERLWSAVSTIYYHWIYNIPEIEGMAALVRRIREIPNVRLFVLSNISLYLAEHADEIPILSLFDECVFSSVCGKVKPNREIFEYLCTKYNMLPCETVFVDDNASNIKGAQDYGIIGYLFDGDVAHLDSYLQYVLKNNAST